MFLELRSNIESRPCVIFFHEANRSVFIQETILHIVFPNSTRNVRHFLLIFLLYICLYIIRLLLLGVGKQKQEWAIETTKVYYYLRHTTKCSALCYWSKSSKDIFSFNYKAKASLLLNGMQQQKESLLFLPIRLLTSHSVCPRNTCFFALP